MLPLLKGAANAAPLILCCVSEKERKRYDFLSFGPSDWIRTSGKYLLRSLSHLAAGLNHGLLDPIIASCTEEMK